MRLGRVLSIVMDVVRFSSLSLIGHTFGILLLVFMQKSRVIFTITISPVKYILFGYIMFAMLKKLLKENQFTAEIQ